MAVQKFRGQKKGGMYYYFLFVTQIKLSHNITELVFVFYFHSVFKLQQGVLHSRNKTRLPNLCFSVCFFSIYKSNFLTLNIFPQFRCYPRIHCSYLTIKSHMHVLKPEAINITRKNIQNVLTNIKIIYIYLYI